MLQQTRVATALPFYQRFLRRFPTVRDLAGARESDVLSLWSGLGYYQRARNLLAAARLIARDRRARFPDDPAEFRRLPGVGRYTAGAVLSIAFDRPLPVLDGNVARVLSRMFARRLSLRDSGGSRILWELAARLVPARSAGAWNQALMELGATVCTPQSPQCGRCPLRMDCVALLQGRVAEFPPPRIRPRIQMVRRAVVLIMRRDRWAMVQQTGRLLGGLWEPPGIELTQGAIRHQLHAELKRLGLVARLQSTPHRLRHTIMQRRIVVQVWRGSLIRDPRGAQVRFIDPNAPSVALTGMARKLAHQVLASGKA